MVWDCAPLFLIIFLIFFGVPLLVVNSVVLFLVLACIMFYLSHHSFDLFLLQGFMQQLMMHSHAAWNRAGWL